MKKLVIVLAAASLVAACAPKEEFTSPFTPKFEAPVFTASLENSTKAYLDGTSVCWEDTDTICIFNKNSEVLKYYYDGEYGATRGDFVIDSAETPTEAPSWDYIYASYPYDSYNEADADGNMLVWFSPSQPYVPDSFGACPMAAVSDNTTLEFKNLCGFLRIPLVSSVSEAVTEIAVYGNNYEKFSGDLAVSIAPGSDPQVAPAGTNYNYTYVYTQFETPLSLSANTPTYVWFAIPPMEFSDGIYVEFSGENGNTFSVTSSNPLTITRNQCITTGVVNVDFPTWNYLGQGTWTDGNLFPLFGKDDVTVECEVYESMTEPGYYMVTGFQKALFCAFYGVDESNADDYEGSYWNNSLIYVDATDVNAVFIPDAEYGLYTGSSYGSAYISADPTGTLSMGTISFPEKTVYVGLSGTGSWYYGNNNGTFAITIPSGFVKPVQKKNAPKGTSASFANPGGIDLPAYTLTGTPVKDKSFESIQPFNVTRKTR